MRWVWECWYDDGMPSADRQTVRGNGQRSVGRKRTKGQGQGAGEKKGANTATRAEAERKTNGARMISIPLLFISVKRYDGPNYTTIPKNPDRFPTCLTHRPHAGEILGNVLTDISGCQSDCTVQIAFSMWHACTCFTRMHDGLCSKVQRNAIPYIHTQGKGAGCRNPSYFKKQLSVSSRTRGTTSGISPHLSPRSVA